MLEPLNTSSCYLKIAKTTLQNVTCVRCQPLSLPPLVTIFKASVIMNLFFFSELSLVVLKDGLVRFCLRVSSGSWDIKYFGIMHKVQWITLAMMPIKVRSVSLSSSHYTSAPSVQSQVKFLITRQRNIIGLIQLKNKNIGTRQDLGISNFSLCLINHSVYETLKLKYDFSGLPFSIYRVFVLEQRHGFNKQTPTFYAKDQIKKFVIGQIIQSPILAAVIKIVYLGGDYFFIYLWMFAVLITLFLMTVYPDFIAPMFDKYTPMPEGQLRYSTFIILHQFMITNIFSGLTLRNLLHL